MKFSRAGSLLAIEATLRESVAGCGRISGPILRGWRKRCAEERRDDLVAVIDRELGRRGALTGGKGTTPVRRKERTLTWVP